MEKYKVVLHINDPACWDTALGNATNLLKGLEPGNAVAICLANGQAVLGYEDQEKVAAMKTLSEQGVIFQACRNSLQKMYKDNSISISEEELPSFVAVVPAGIIALISLQQKGYAYVKP